MMSFRRSTLHDVPSRRRPALVAATVVLAAAAAAAATAPLASSAQQPSLSQLHSSLGQTQARASSLSASVASLARLISSLDGQIALVQSREADVRAALAADRARVAGAQQARQREQRVLATLRARLSRARMILSQQLVSNYERARPDLVTVVLESHGFTDLLDRLTYLHHAEQEQQSLIQVTRAAKAQAEAAARRLARLEAADRALANEQALRAKALAAMNALLLSKQTAVRRARAAQQAALEAARARGARLRAAISRVEAQQAAAQAAAQAATQAATQVGTQRGTQAGTQVAGLPPSGGWAIPYPIVLCESGGQDLPPNGAGASGYYQIVPGTWRLFGGSGPAAYLASKAEQDAVAARIWNGGAGASNWVCAGIVGIH
jgi:septal ring factor EnvC (AmiA/AmiB activator)